LQAPQRQNVANYDDALVEILRQESQAYRYFLQEWGEHCRNFSPSSPTTRADVDMATALRMS
jgi:hypothetical protein